MHDSGGHLNVNVKGLKRVSPNISYCDFKPIVVPLAILTFGSKRNRDLGRGIGRLCITTPFNLGKGGIFGLILPCTKEFYCVARRIIVDQFSAVLAEPDSVFRR
jgi:hypothetical protein